MPKSKIHFPCHEFSMASFVETSLQMCLVKNYVDDILYYYFLLYTYIHTCMVGACIYMRRKTKQ